MMTRLRARRRVGTTDVADFASTSVGLPLLEVMAVANE